MVKTSASFSEWGGKYMREAGGCGNVNKSGVNIVRLYGLTKRWKL
jgi:hypothetical protein